jgi:hypothetical protein
LNTVGVAALVVGKRTRPSPPERIDYGGRMVKKI